MKKANGLLRQFFSKQTDFRAVSWQEAQTAVDHLNTSPKENQRALNLQPTFQQVLSPAGGERIPLTP